MENLSTNFSLFTNQLHPNTNYWTIGYYFSFFLITISFTTVAANILLLLVLYRDPLKSFRTPLNYFVLSLSLTDLVAGLTYEPFSAVCYQLVNYDHPSTKQCLYYLTSYLSVVTRIIWKISPLLICALTVVQFIVVASPLKFARKVTKKTTILTAGFIWLYSIVFEIVHLTLSGQVRIVTLVTTTDITIHNIFIPWITLAVYVSLYREFKRRAAQGLSVRSESLEQTNRERRRNRTQQNLLRVNLLLVVVLLLCTVPYAGTQLAYLWFGVSAPEFQFIPLATFSLKLMLHTIVFAWRMPQYRTAFRAILCYKSTRRSSRVQSSPVRRIPMTIGTYSA